MPDKTRGQTIAGIARAAPSRGELARRSSAAEARQNARQPLPVSAITVTRCDGWNSIGVRYPPIFMTSLVSGVAGEDAREWMICARGAA